jgi:hypothetical protein
MVWSLAQRTGSTRSIFIGGHGQWHCGGGSALVLALYGGSNIIWWHQVHAAFIVIIILPDTPALPSIDNLCVQHCTSLVSAIGTFLRETERRP